MGDAQSAQREGMKDEAGEEESGKVDDAQAEQSPEDKPFKNNGQISEINEKAGSSVAEVNDHCEDEIATDAILTPDEEVSETEKPLEEEETPSKYIQRNEIESSNEADVAEDVPLDMIEMDAKTNDINDGFRRFFSNIGLRLSIKRGSTDLLRDLPDETNHDEPSGQENLEDSAEEIQIEDAEQNTDVNIAQVSTDNDSTTCPTMSDVTPEDVLENAEEKATEAKEDVESDNADESITSPAVEDTHTRPEEEPNSLSPPEQEEVVSPIKRFFTTGIFSGLRKKRKAVEDDVNDKEMVDMGKKEEDKEQIDPGVEAAVVDTEHKENELKQEILTVTSAEKADEGKSPTTDHSTAIDTTTIFPESETLNSHEKDKVQASPLKRLLSGSSFKKLSKKPRSRRSSDAKLSDSGEHAADQLLSSTESTENQKEDKSTQPSPEAAGEEDGAWVSFKKLLTPKKHTRTPSLSNKETEIPDTVEEPKPSDGQQISDHSTEEGKKRKDSSVSWEAVLCRSGKKRSRKTSDSEDESPQIDDNKQDIGSKNGAELPEESANEKKNDVSVSSPKQSPLIGDGGSTWKSFKRLVTPKRKVKDEDEGKDNIQSDSEVSQDESSFSIKKLLPGRKKRKSTEKQDHVSSDEADKDVPSDDEDSETPAVVPMSEFDTPESLVQIQTQVDIESHFPKEVPQDLLQQMPKPVLPCDSLQNEAKKLEENVDAVDNGTSTIPATIEQLDDVSEIISKHQQLSDITEEGIITETMATPASINEEVGRDDTLAEDLLEITSEAITAPEPASVTTLADETEMISAVSQLSSESSKTSGNTTPVPAEYEVKETEELLHQVVENISTSPMAVPISSATPKSESIVGSVWHHIFRTFVKEDKETTILEIHRKSDATAINTGQTAEELDAVNEVAAKAQTESISEVNDSDPKEFLPEVLEKLDTADITKDEVHEVHPIDPEQSLKELERINEIENDSHHQVESQSEANAAGSVVESVEAEVETPEMGTEDTTSKEFKEETEPEGELLVKAAETDEEDTVKDSKTEVAFIDTHVVTESTEEGSATIPHTEGSLESVDPSKTVHVQEPEVQESLFGLLMRSLLPQKKVSSDDLSPKVTEVGDEPEQKLPDEAVTAEYFQKPEGLQSEEENNVKETKNEEGIIMDEHEVTGSIEGDSATLPICDDKIKQVDASKTEKEPQELQTLQLAILDPGTGGILSFEQKIFEDITALETVRDEQKNETELRVEPEEKIIAKSAKIDDIEEPEVLPSDVEDSVMYLKTEEGAPTGMQVVTEYTEEGSETIPHTEGSLEPEDPSKTDHVEEPEESQTVQESLLGQLMHILLPQKKVLSDDLSQKETVKDEPQPEIEVREEPEENLPAEAEHIPEPEVITTVQEAQLDSRTTNLSLEKEIFEDITALEKVRDEPQNETELRVEPEEKLQVKGANTHYVQESEILPSDVEDSVKYLKTDEGAPTDMQVVTECTVKGSETIPHTEGSLEPEDPSKTDHVEEPEVSQTAQESLLGQLMRSLLPQKKVLSDDLSQKETVKDEPQPTTEVREESEENLPIEAEHIPEPEVITTVQEAQLDSRTTNLSLEKVILEDITALETVRDEPQNKTELRVEPEEKRQAKGAKIDDIEEPEVLPSNVEYSVKDIKTEEGASTGMQVVTECTEEGSETIPHTEGSLEPEDPSKTDHVEEPEESQTVQESLLGQLMHILLPQKKVLSDDLSQKETVTDESQPATEVRDESEENVPVEAEHTPETEVITTVQEAQLDSRTTNLSLEREIFEDITALETVKDEPRSETELRVEPEEKRQAKGAKIDDIEEPEVLPSDVEYSVKDIKTEEGASTGMQGMQVVTECTEEGSETIPHIEGSLEPEDPSKTDHVEEPEESQTVQESLLGQLMRSLLPQKIVLSADLSQKETVKDEPQAATEVREESEENLPAEAEHTQEPEVITTVQEAQLDSRTTNLSLEKVILEDITAVETVRDEPQNETELRVEPEEKLQVKGANTHYVQEPEVLPSDVEDSVKDIKAEGGAPTDMQVVTECSEEGSETIPHTEGSLEPEDPSKTDHVEAPEESQTVQESLLGQLMHILIPQKKVLSDDLSQKETVKDEPQPTTEVREEPEENVPVEAKHTPEPEVITTVQEAQLDTRTTNLSLEKVILEDITTVETVKDKPQNETELRVEPDEKLQVKGAKIDDIEEPEVLPSDVEDSVKDIKTEEGASTGMQVVTECTEEGSETIPHTEGSLEPEDPSKTDHVEEPEESQTVQESLLGQLMHILLPQKKVLSDDLSQKETVTDEPQPATEVRDESEENVPVEAEHTPEPEVITTVQEAQLDSRTTNLSLEKVEDITALEKVSDEPQNETELRVEPEAKLQVKGANTHYVQEPEVLPSDVEDSVKDIKTEEGASTGMQVVTECTVEGSETIPHTESSLEPEDPSKTDHVEEPEELQTAQESLLGQLMRSLLPQKKVLSDDLSQKETVKDEPQPTTEVREESEENLPIEAEHIPEPEVITTVQEAQLDSRTTNLSLEKVILEDITALETVKDEPQNETELRVEPEEKRQAKGAKIDDIEEPEVLPSDVEYSVKDIKTEEGASTDMQVVTECTEEGSETIPHTEGSLESEDPSKTDHVEEPEESQTVQESLLGQLMHILLPQKNVLSDDLSQKETVTDEPQPATEVRDESEENVPVEAEHTPETEVITTVQEAQLDSRTTNLSLEKVEDITALEKVGDKPQNETELRVEPEAKLQVKGANTHYVQEPEVLPSDVEYSVKDIKTEEGASTGMQVVTECTVEGSETIPHTESSLEPEDPSKTDHVEEPEASQTAQESLLGQLMRSLLPQKKVLSDDLSQKETVKDEPQPTTEVREESEENLPIEAEHIPEPEVITTVQEAQLDSRTTNLSLEKGIFADITAVETVKDEPQNENELRVEPDEKLHVKGAKIDDIEEPEVLPSDVEDSVKDIKTEEGASTGMQVVTECTEEGSETIPHTEGSLEPEDPSKTDHVEEPEESQTVQESLLGQLMHILLPQKKVLSDDLSQKETVTDETQPETEVREESEENVLVEDEHIPETEVITTVQEAQLDSRASSQSHEKVILEDITAVETVRDEPQNETELRVEPEEKLQVKVANTDDVQESEVSEMEDSVKDTKTEEGASTCMQVVTECTEEGSATIPHTEGSLEPVDPSKTDNVEEPEESQTVQESLLGQLMHVLLPQKKVLSDDLSQKETVKDEAQSATEVREEPEENVPVEAEHTLEPEVITTVQEAQLDSRTTNLSFEKVILEDITAVETVRDRPRKQTELRVEPEEKLQVKGANTHYVQEPEVLPSDVEDSVKDIKAERGAPTDMQVVTECTEEGSATIPQKEDNLEPVDPSKTEYVSEPEVKESLLGLLMHSLLPHKKVSSDDLSPKDTLTNEPQPRTEVRDEPEKNVPVEAVTTEYVHEPEALPSDIEETVKETRSKEGTLTDLHVITESEMGMATLPLIEGALEPVDHSKTELVQEPEQLQTVQSSRLDSKAGSPLIEQILSDDITAVATFTDEHTLEAEVRMELEEEQPVEASKTEYVQEQEILSSDAKDNVKETKTEEHTSMYIHAVTETTVPMPDADNTIASVTDTIEREVVAQFHQAAEESDGHKTELIINNAHVFEQEDSIPEVTEELQAIPQAHVSSVDEESKYVQVLEKTIFSEEIQAPAVDNATIKDELKHEVHLSAVQLGVEREKESELSSTKIKTAALEYAIVTQVVTCDMKEVSAAIPDLLQEKTLDITEPMIDRVASQEVFGEANTTKPLVKEQNTLIQRTHVPSVEFEGNHKIQVQVVDVNLKSVGTIVDNVLEVGVTEMKEVIDYCQETMETVENLSATPDIEKEFTHEETKITVGYVPEKVSESAVTILEKAVKQPDALTAVSELAESESNQMGNQKVVKDGTGTLTEKDEKYFVIIDDSAIAQQVSVHLTHTQDLPFDLNVCIGSQREKLEQTKTKQAKSEAGVTVGEVKVLSEESDVEEVNEPAQITQISQGPIVTPSNTGLVVPQNTGIMSSIGNVGSPSSLSLEFKLNLQFGQAKAQTPSPPTEKIEPMNKTHVSGVGVQGAEAVEPVKPIIPTQRAESHNQIDLTEVEVKPATHFVYTERALITTQPDLSDSGINTNETVESITKGPAFPPMPTNRIETVKQTDVIVVGVQAVESVETVKPIIQTECAGSEKQIEPTVVNVAPKEITGPDSLLVLTERAVITTQPVMLDVAIHAIKTVELASKAQTSKSLTKIMDCTEPVKQMDVLEDGSQAIQALETVTPINVTQSSESLTKIEAAEVNEQPTEITKPAENLVFIERALITTHPQILEVGMHFFKTVEQVAKASDSPPSTTDRTETEKETDVSVVGFQALKATEPANTVIPPEKEIQKQIEPTEVNNQSTEITEPATILESTKRAVITTHPELLVKVLPSDAEDTMKDTKNEEAASIDTDVVKESTKESATIPHTEDSLEPGDPSNTEHVQEPEVKESLLGQLMRSLLPHKKECQPKTEVRDEQEDILGGGIHPTEAVELVEKTTGSAPPTTDQEQIEPTEVNDQPIEITEPVANLVETALITTQPELLNVGINTIQKVEEEATAPPSSPAITERIELGKQMNISEHGVQAEEAEEPVNTILPAQRAESPKQIELSEVNIQQSETTEPEDQLVSNEKASIITLHEVLGEVLPSDAVDTVKDTKIEEAASVDTDVVKESTEENATIPHTEDSLEPGDPSKTEHVQEPEVKESLLGQLMRSLLPHKKECQPKTEVRDEQEDILGGGIHPTEAVELVEKTTGSAPPTTDQEQIEPTVINNQPIEITEPVANLVETALITTQPELLNVGINTIQKVEEEATAPPSSPAITERIELGKQMNISEHGVQAEEAEEPVNTILPAQRAESPKQIELSEVNIQQSETTEPEDQLVSNEKASIITLHEVLGEVLPSDAVDTVKDTKIEEAASVDTDVVKESTEENATIPHTEDSLEPGDPSKTEHVQEPEVKESLLGQLMRSLLPHKKECQPKTEVRDEQEDILGGGIHPTEAVELVEKTTGSAPPTTDQEQIEPTVINNQPIEITEPVANLVQTALITTQPELLNVGINTIQKVEQEATAPPSSPAITERIELGKQINISEHGVQAEEAEEPVNTILPAQRAESPKQIELSEVNIQQSETTEPEDQLVSNEKASIITLHEVLGEVLPSDAVDTVKDTKIEEAASVDTDVVKESTEENATIPHTEDSLEPGDPLKTEHVQEPEVKESLLGQLMRSLLPHKKECQPKTEVRDEQEDILGGGIHPTEAVELVEKTTGSAPPTTDQEQIEPTVINNLPIEITEPVANLVETALITTQPELLNVGINTIQKVEEEATAPPSSPAITERIELGKQMNISEHGVQAEEAEEPVNTILPAQRAESPKQIELSEVNIQQSETTEPEDQLVSNEKASIITLHEVLGEVLPSDAVDTVKDTKIEEAASVDTDVVKESTEENATIPHTEDSLEPGDPSKTEHVQEPEVKESLLGQLMRSLLPHKKECQPKTEVRDEQEDILGGGIHPTEAVELVEKTTGSAPPTTDQEQIEPTVINNQPIEITEPVANLVETALITTQPELLNVGINTIQKVEQEATAPPSSPAITERIELGKQINISEHGVQAEEAEEPVNTILPAHRAESPKQIELSEVNIQQSETTEPEDQLVSNEKASIITLHEVLGEVLPSDTVDTVKDTKIEEAASVDTDVVKESTEENATIPHTEDSLEPGDPSKTEHVQEPEVKESLLGQLMRSLLPHKKECQPKTEVRDEQEDILGGGIHPTEAVELVEKTTGSAPPTTDQEQIEPTEVNNQPIEITEPVANLVETALITTQPELLDVGMHQIETVEPLAKASASQPQVPTSITKSLKETNVSKVVIQVEEAVESEMPIHSTQRAESQEEPELTETNAQATEVTEPTGNVVITTEPVLLDNGIHPTTTAELVSNVQANETMQPASQTEEREVFQGEPVQSEDFDQETKSNVNNTEEENDQDVWMDAEEVIYNQEGTEVSSLEVEEPEEPDAECVHEEEARLEEVELASNSRTEEEESQQEVYKRGETCEIESDGEDFAIALEHQEYATASIATLEWD